MSHACPLFNTTLKPDAFLKYITKNCGNCDTFNGVRCSREDEIKLLGKENEDMLSSEAHKAGIVPPKPVEEMTPEELKAFRNSMDPDMMGFDGKEVEGEE